MNIVRNPRSRRCSRLSVLGVALLVSLCHHVQAQIAYRASSSASSGSSSVTTLTLTKPASVAVGDYMVASLNAGASDIVVPPSDWTLIETITDGIRMRVYGKMAGPSEPASYTWKLEAARKMVAGMVAFSGVDSITPVQASAAQAHTSTTASTTHATPSITVSGSGRWLVAVFGDNGSTWTPPSGMTERVDVQNSGTSPASLSINTQSSVSSGSHSRTGTGSISTTTAAAAIVALNPACAVDQSDDAAAVRTFYVKPTGSDTAAGTSWATAWKTAQKAVDTATQPGDHVVFERGGTYGRMDFVGNSGTSANRRVFKSDLNSTGTKAKFAQTSTSSSTVSLDGTSYVTFKDLEISQSGYRGLRLNNASNIIWKDGDIHGTQKRGISIGGSSSNGRFENLMVYDTGPDAGAEQDQHGVKISIDPPSTGGHFFKNIRIYDAGEDDVQTESTVSSSTLIATFEDFIFGTTLAGATDSGFENSIDIKGTGRLIFRRGIINGGSNRDETVIDHSQTGGSLTMESVRMTSNGSKRAFRVDGWNADLNRCWFTAANRAVYSVGGAGNTTSVKNCVFENTGGTADSGIVKIVDGTHTIESSTIVTSGSTQAILVYEGGTGSVSVDQCFLWRKNNTTLFSGNVADGTTKANFKRTGDSISDLFPLSGANPYDPIIGSAIHDVVSSGIRTDEYLGRTLDTLQSYGAYDPRW